MQCTLYSVHCTLHTAHSVQCTVYSVQCTVLHLAGEVITALVIAGGGQEPGQLLLHSPRNARHQARGVLEYLHCTYTVDSTGDCTCSRTRGSLGALR